MSSPPPPGPIKAVFFDFMGTCLDWCSSVAEDGLPDSLPLAQRREFALQWRVAYFYENQRRLDAGLPTENIDDTLARTLDAQLQKSEYAHVTKSLLDDGDKQRAVAAWHHQRAWSDVEPALQHLRSDGLELFVHANGTTRLQLDLCRSAGLHFDMIMSSQMLGQVKPSPQPYTRALEWIARTPAQVVMVAAHVMDLRGAKAVGMPTIYIRRATDDIHEDLSRIDGEFDVVLDDMHGLRDAVRELNERRS